MVIFWSKNFTPSNKGSSLNGTFVNKQLKFSGKDIRSYICRQNKFNLMLSVKWWISGPNCFRTNYDPWWKSPCLTKQVGPQPVNEHSPRSIPNHCPTSGFLSNACCAGNAELSRWVAHWVGWSMRIDNVFKNGRTILFSFNAAPTCLENDNNRFKESSFNYSNNNLILILAGLRFHKVPRPCQVGVQRYQWWVWLVYCYCLLKLLFSFLFVIE